MEDINDSVANLNLGKVVDFQADFEVSSFEGVLTFGVININTDDEDDEMFDNKN